jgi:CRISPR-associated protein Csx14
MSEQQASITVAVDPTNPGQFFACCGLLELADRLWPGAEGWFTADGREFKIAFTDEKGTLRELLATLIMDPPTSIQQLDNGLEVAPIIAPLAFSFDGGSTTGLVLDAWTRIAALRGTAQVISNPPWNFWAGNQTSTKIWSSLRAELVAQLRRWIPSEFNCLFSQRLLQGGRFGFDPGPAWNALDVGFSLNEHGVEVESSPATELLAAVGLQRFRPLMNDDRDGFDYFTWHKAYSPPIAAAAMAGGVRDRHTVRYRATVTSRGQYAALGFAFPLTRGESDE